ncbi:hypothetical protein Droror1_Dr00010287 [Drosera rotundifolia]
MFCECVAFTPLKCCFICTTPLLLQQFEIETAVCFALLLFQNLELPCHFPSDLLPLRLTPFRSIPGVSFCEGMSRFFHGSLSVVFLLIFTVSLWFLFNLLLL